MSRPLWQPAPGDDVIVYTSRDYGMHGRVVGIWGRMATVRLVNGQLTDCHFCDLSPGFLPR